MNRPSLNEKRFFTVLTILCFCLAITVAFAAKPAAAMSSNNINYHGNKFFAVGVTTQTLDQARTASREITTQGGAGYIVIGDTFNVLMSAYNDADRANTVASNNNAQTITIAIPTVSFDIQAEENQIESTNNAFAMLDSLIDGLIAQTTKLSTIDARNEVDDYLITQANMLNLYCSILSGINDFRIETLIMHLEETAILLENQTAIEETQYISQLRYNTLTIIYTTSTQISVMRNYNAITH